MQNIPWKPPRKLLPGSSDAEIEEHRKEIDVLQESSRQQYSKQGDKKSSKISLEMILYILLILFIIGIFTNWFRLGNTNNNSKSQKPIIIDCEKYPNKCYELEQRNQEPDYWDAWWR